MKREIPIKSFAISLFILKPDDEDFRLLLLRRTGSTLTGAWCQIAGGIEDGETAWQAAIREAEEETGLIIRNLYSADVCEQFYEADRDAITLTPVFVAFVNTDCTVCLNDEHDDYKWVSFDEANLMLPFAGQRATLEHIKKEFIDRKPNGWLKIDVEKN